MTNQKAEWVDRVAIGRSREVAHTHTHTQHTHKNI